MKPIISIFTLAVAAGISAEHFEMNDISDSCKAALKSVHEVQLNTCHLSFGQNSTSEMDSFCANVDNCVQEARTILQNGCRAELSKQRRFITSQYELGIQIGYKARCIKDSQGVYCHPPYHHYDHYHDQNDTETSHPHIQVDPAQLVQFCNGCWPGIKNNFITQLEGSSASDITKQLYNNELSYKNNPCENPGSTNNGGSGTGTNNTMIAGSSSITSISVSILVLSSFASVLRYT